MNDLELGELIGSVKALEKSIDKDRHTNESNFKAINDKLENMLNLITNRAKEDYTYLDDKADRIISRVTAIEVFKENWDKEIQKKKDSWSSKFKDRFTATAISLGTTGIFLFVYSLVSDYIKKGT